jgi:tRNA G37 N-methylase TrmD
MKNFFTRIHVNPRKKEVLPESYVTSGEKGRYNGLAKRQAERLTRFAVFTRYPGISPPVTPGEYEEAVSIAEAVIRWAEGVIGTSLDPSSEASRT